MVYIVGKRALGVLKGSLINQSRDSLLFLGLFAVWLSKIINRRQISCIFHFEKWQGNCFLFLNTFLLLLFSAAPSRGRHSRLSVCNSPCPLPPPLLTPTMFTSSFTTAMNLLCSLSLFLMPGSPHLQHPLSKKLFLLNSYTYTLYTYIFGLTFLFVQKCSSLQVCEHLKRLRVQADICKIERLLNISLTKENKMSVRRKSV